MARNKYLAVLTHNPQDFFDGTEPNELCETVEFKRLSRSVRKNLLGAVRNGYKAIIFDRTDKCNEVAIHGRKINVDQDRQKYP